MKSLELDRYLIVVSRRQTRRLHPGPRKASLVACAVGVADPSDLQLSGKRHGLRISHRRGRGFCHVWPGHGRIDRFPAGGQSLQRDLHSKSVGGVLHLVFSQQDAAVFPGAVVDPNSQTCPKGTQTGHISHRTQRIVRVAQIVVNGHLSRVQGRRDRF